MNEIIVRSASGLVGLAITIIVTLKGEIYLSFFVLLLSLIGLYELYRALENANYKPVKLVGYFFSIVLFLKNLGTEILSLEFITTVLLIILLIMLIFKESLHFEDIAITFLSIFYVPFLFNYITYLDKTKYIWLIYIIAWGTDTFAYIFGNLFGKKKLCPNISPNKTIGGSIGGIFGSVLLTVVFSKLIKLGSISYLIPLGILVSIMAQFGDLVASRIKRLVDIKDFGDLIPGHGGILDRFDSILLTAPAVYYYVKYFLI